MTDQNDSQSTPNLLENVELDNFKQKTDQLMSHLEQNDIESALSCIKDINDINGKNFYSTIGKLTRGLHNAISDLSISSNKDQSENNKTRVDLNYVISVTDDAAKQTLDMTEKSKVNVRNLTQSNDEQEAIIATYLSSHTPDEATTAMIKQLSSLNQQSKANTDQVNSNISQIIMAQNFQDITSQTITKAIGIINEVEGSLIALTQHANLLSKLAQFSDVDKADIDLNESEELKSDIDQINTVTKSEHLDQSDVDNLLSSMGF